MPSCDVLEEALARAGRKETLRHDIAEALRRAQRESSEGFRDEVRWPIVRALLGVDGTQRVELRGGLLFDLQPDSRIERAALLSAEAHPTHIWEPQTTRLLTAICSGIDHALVGGAYIGDQALPMAQVLAPRSGFVHAFEPMSASFARLLHNIALNDIVNIRPWQLALWDESGRKLTLRGEPALAATEPGHAPGAEAVESITLDDYVAREGLASTGLIMLDLEGGEERTLAGASRLLQRPAGAAPHLVFEVHREYVDWSEGLARTTLFRSLKSLGYEAYAIRDFHDNWPINTPIEIIPIETVYLGGPPHGFNVLATKDRGLVERLDLSVVSGVSPKLLHDKDPKLHHPLDGIDCSPHRCRLVAGGPIDRDDAPIAT